MGPAEQQGETPDPEGTPEHRGVPADVVETMLRILNILRRRWPIVLGTAILVCATGFGIVSTMRPYWSASVSVLVNTQTPSNVLDTVRGVNDEEVMWSPSAFLDYVGTQQEIIRSRKVALAALERVEIEEDPVFLGVDAIEDPVLRDEIAATVDPVAQLQATLSVIHLRDSRVLSIAVEYPDPTWARDLANAVADAYVAELDVSREATGEKAKTSLSEERTDAAERLRAADDALDAFKQQEGITTISLSDRQSLITENVMKLSGRAKEAQSSRIEAEALYAEAKKLHDAGRIASTSMLPPSERLVFDEMLAERLEAEREFTEVQNKYLADHPRHVDARRRLELVERRIKETSEDLLGLLRAQLDAARATEVGLQRALDAEHEKALQLGRLEPQFRELEREATAAEEAYVLLARRDAEVGLTNRVEAASPVEVLDYATLPGEPVRPRKTLLLSLAALIGIGLGSVLALAVDLRDQRIRSMLDLERALSHLGLPILGHIPLLPPDPVIGSANVKAQRRQRDLYAFLHPQSHMAERCRGIRTALAFALPAAGAQVLLVTSPGTGEGKSSTSINLAISYCLAKKRVVLVDADMRRPRVHQVFPPPVERSEIGLSSVLRGQASVDEAVQSHVPDGPEELAVLTCGEIPSNPAELLDGAGWRRVLAELKERFDVVIIDSPPLLPVTDPLIAATQVDGVILVARCGATTRSVLQRAVGMLRHTDTNLLGIVLNQVDPRAESRGYGYGYGYSYGYSYKSPYYTYGPREKSAEQA